MAEGFRLRIFHEAAAKRHPVFQSSGGMTEARGFQVVWPARLLAGASPCHWLLARGLSFLPHGPFQSAA